MNLLKSETDKISRVLKTLCAHYTNKKQAQELQDELLYASQEMVLTPIWQEKRRGEHWFYLGWFPENQYKQSLGEGILQLKRHNRDSFSLQIYPLDQNYPLAWQEEKPFENLELKDLKPVEGCQIWLQETQLGRLSLHTQGLCAYTMSDQIHYLQLHFEIDGLTLLDFSAYYDANRALIFAYPQDKPVIFQKREKFKKNKN